MEFERDARVGDVREKAAKSATLSASERERSKIAKTSCKCEGVIRTAEF